MKKLSFFLMVLTAVVSNHPINEKIDRKMMHLETLHQTLQEGVAVQKRIFKNSIKMCDCNFELACEKELFKKTMQEYKQMIDASSSIMKYIVLLEEYQINKNSVPDEQQETWKKIEKELKNLEYLEQVLSTKQYKKEDPLLEVAKFNRLFHDIEQETTSFNNEAVHAIISGNEKEFEQLRQQYLKKINAKLDTLVELYPGLKKIYSL